MQMQQMQMVSQGQGQGQDTSMIGMLEESMLDRYDEIRVAADPADEDDDDDGTFAKQPWRDHERQPEPSASC